MRRWGCAAERLCHAGDTKRLHPLSSSDGTCYNAPERAEGVLFRLGSVQTEAARRKAIHLSRKLTVPIHTGWVWVTRKAVLKPIDLIHSKIDDCPVQWMNIPVQDAVARRLTILYS